MTLEKFIQYVEKDSNERMQNTSKVFKPILIKKSINETNLSFQSKVIYKTSIFHIIDYYCFLGEEDISVSSTSMTQNELNLMSQFYNLLRVAIK